MRIVGNNNRDELVLDPIEALRRGATLDEHMKILLPPHPRGVWRGSHQFFNRMDDARATAMARRVNLAPRAYPTTSG